MSEQLKQITQNQCKNTPAKYDDLKALFLNCTLNRTPAYIQSISSQPFELSVVKSLTEAQLETERSTARE